MLTRAGAVLPALQAAAERTGVDFGALFQTARLESGFDPKAEARTSTATGLFQFIESTWLSTLAKYGERHGFQPAGRAEALALRRDPMAASLMAAEHMSENAAALEKRLGRSAGPVDLYMAHFLGAGGAVRFFERLAQTPDLPADQLLPSAARANRPIFYSGGAPRSLAEVHALFTERLTGSKTPGAPSIGGGARPGAAPSAVSSPTVARLLAAVEHPGSPGERGGGEQARALQDALNLVSGQQALAQPAAAQQAARIAYLLLAELGG